MIGYQMECGFGWCILEWELEKPTALLFRCEILVEHSHRNEQINTPVCPCVFDACFHDDRIVLLG